MGRGLARERLAAYHHGYHMVVRGAGGDLAQPRQGRCAEAELYPGLRSVFDWVGHVSASAGADDERGGAYHVWLYPHGGGSIADH